MRIERARRGLRFAGYASVFDRIDRGGDIVRAGAFRQSLDRNGKIPLLWQHQQGRVVGKIEHLAEDARGLQVIGRLHDDEFGRLLARKLKAGRLWRALGSAGQGPASRVPGPEQASSLRSPAPVPPPWLTSHAAGFPIG